MMRNPRRFQLDELILAPGTYFNPLTEIMIVVDDSPEVDHELFEGAEVGAADWVQISEDTPVDEQKRDELVERFQLAHQPDGDGDGDDDLDIDQDDLDEDLDDDEDLDEDDELGGVDDLEFERE